MARMNMTIHVLLNTPMKVETRKNVVENMLKFIGEIPDQNHDKKYNSVEYQSLQHRTTRCSINKNGMAWHGMANNIT